MNSDKEYFYQLDFFRSLSALLVVLYHNPFANHLSAFSIVKYGDLCVDFFFVLSGFVIYHNYAERISSVGNFVRYLVARFARVYPLHLLTLMVFVGIEFLKYFVDVWFGMRSDPAPFTHSNGDALLANMFLLTAHGLSGDLTFNGPSWSISAEFTAYVVFGLLALGFGARSRWFTWIGIVFVIGGAATLWHLSSDSAAYKLGWIRCLIGFFCGVFVYQFRAVSKLKFNRTVVTCLQIAAVGLLISAMSLPTWLPLAHERHLVMDLVAAYFIWAFTVSPTVLADVTGKFGAGMFGKLSYGIYMWHMALIWGASQVATIIFKSPRVFDAASGKEVITVEKFAGDGMTLLLVLGTLLVAYVSFAYFEDPARKAIKLENTNQS